MRNDLCRGSDPAPRCKQRAAQADSHKDIGTKGTISRPTISGAIQQQCCLASSFQGMTKPPRPDGIRNSPDRMPGLFMPPPALP